MVFEFLNNFSPYLQEWITKLMDDTKNLLILFGILLISNINMNKFYIDKVVK